MSARRVTPTEAAGERIARLVARHGPLLFHQSGGCCDGSAPRCLPRADLLIGAQAVCLGEIGRQPLYTGAAQFEYWPLTRLTLDVVPGRAGMFPLEGPLGVSVTTRSRPYTPQEEAALAPARRGPVG
jgi:uncharacterized protein (DUF779 family)